VTAQPAVPAKALQTPPAPAGDASTADSNSTPANAAQTNPAAATPVGDSNSATLTPSTTAVPEKSGSEATKTPAPVESSKEVITAPSDAELPGEKTAVILSSQGAEKRLMSHLPANYPADARRAGIEGTVVLKTVVNEAGKVQGVRLVEGNPTLAMAAISSVKQWHYRPYVREGKAVPFQTIVLVEFQRP